MTAGAAARRYEATDGEGPAGRRGSGRGALRLIEGGLSARSRVAPARTGTATLRALAAGAVALALVIGASSLSSALVASRYRAATEGLATSRHVVSSGESLWGLAEQHPIDGLSTEQTVSYLRAENSLDGTGLVVGQVVLVPSGERD